MAHPTDCPGWQYSDHPSRAALLPTRVAALLAELRRGILDTLRVSCDTRPVHSRLFEGLTPDRCDYYAGHYRGESFRCLRDYGVGIPSDPRVGYPPAEVNLAMARLAALLHDGLAVLDQATTAVNVAPGDKALFVVILACRFFDLFLRIHPYADGNGHTSRFLIWAILGRYGYWPFRWTIEPRPSDPPYTDIIVAYRGGFPSLLENYVLSCLKN